MSRWAPCKRRDFIKKLRAIGFDGLYSGTNHQFLLFGNYRLAIPTNSEYSVPQLKMMLNEVEEIINRKILFDEWNKL